MNRTSSSSLLLAALAGAALSSTACLDLPADDPYDYVGHTIYYDSIGRPYYVVDGTAIYAPPSCRCSPSNVYGGPPSQPYAYRTP